MLQLDFLLPLLPWLMILLAWVLIMAIDSVAKLGRYGIEIGPFMLMARTQRFNNLLDRIGRWHPRAWRFIWSGFIAVAFIFSIIGFYLLCINLVELIKFYIGAPAAPGPVVPIVPGVTIGFNLFLTILIPLIVAVVVHELAHGIAARSDDIPVKSSGLFALLIFFGAFVEPDEEYVKTQTTRRQRARLYASGSGANLSVALIAFAMLTLIIVPIPNGALIHSVVPGSSADGVLAPGMIITGMNDTTIATSTDLSMFMIGTNPGDLIIFTLNTGIRNLTVGVNPDNASQAMIGITVSTYFPLNYPFSLLGPFGGLEFQRSLSWFFIIMLSLGVLNLLPIPPFDGDRLFKELIDATIGLKRASGRGLLWALRIFALTLLALNVILTLLNPSLILIFFG